MSTRHEPKIELDHAIAALRDDEPPPAAAEAAAARAWERVARETATGSPRVEAIRGCADVRALLDAHRTRSLEPPRALLVEDHLRECAACRAAFRHPGRARLAILPWRPASEDAPQPVRGRRMGMLAAAAALAAVAAGVAVRQAFLAPPPGSRARVQSVSGGLQAVAAVEGSALGPGRELGDGERVRTARGARAQLLLRDGSLLEMGESAELSVTARGSDTTIQLDRGSIIVQAAKRRTGQLLVASQDCTVSVTGTVFSVSGGLKGSRVSVIEGQVRVSRDGEERLLQPGEQWATSAAMGAVALRDEIGWSRDLDQHLALLGELQALRERWSAVRLPGLRYESRLLRLLPRQAVLFAAIPNYGEALADAHRLFEERLRESAVLAEWWQRADPARHGGPSLAAAIQQVESFAEFLGDEVALAAVDTGHGPQDARPVLLAEVRRPGLRERISEALVQLREQGGQPPVVRFLDDTAPVPAEKPEVFVLLREDVVAVAADAGVLQALAAGGSGFEQTPLGQRLLETYRDGVGVVFGADLGSLAAGEPAAQASGLDSLRHLIVAEKEIQGSKRTEAALAFAGPRRGIASWLAAPGPMGALDFVSPHALGAAAFLSKSPARVLDDLLAIEQSGGASPRNSLLEIESKLDLRLREDLLDTLGGELALALDGPLLPTPAWKLVAEVYDPARLQTSLHVLVGKANEELLREGRPPLRLTSEQTGAQVCHSLTGGGLPFELHYTFAGGYLVAAPSRALVLQALRTRESGDTLARSALLRELLPPGRADHVSGLVFQNLASLAGTFGDVGGAVPLTPEQRRSLAALGVGARPTLVCAYGEEDGIRLASSAGFLRFDPADLALPLLLGRIVPETAVLARP